MTYYSDNSITILNGDCRDVLATLPDQSVNCCVTSPPYFGLRDYGTAQWEGGDEECDHRQFLGGNGDASAKQLSSAGTQKYNYRSTCGKCGALRIDNQIGLEPTPDEYVAEMVKVFREVKRVLRDDGTLWLNIGDSYAGGGGHSPNAPSSATSKSGKYGDALKEGGIKPQGTIKAKDLIGIPWALAKALRDPYYAGQIKKESDRVWLAAIIDGEGCFFIHKRKAGTPSYSKFTRADGSEASYERTADTYGVGLEICNTNKAIIDQVALIVGGGTFTEQSPQQNNRRKQTIYRWRVAPNEAKRIAQEVYPYLVAKQHQARLLFGCPSNGNDGAAAHQAMMDLHNGTETWIDYPAPPSLFEQGYYLRQDIIWSKNNPMPESVTDRCTKAHEYIFLLSKSQKYYYNQEAIKENGGSWNGSSFTSESDFATKNRLGTTPRKKTKVPAGWKTGPGSHGTIHDEGRTQVPEYVEIDGDGKRNKRSVWNVATTPYAEAHFATFPPDLIRPCILAGCPEGGTVLDPFAGSGTTLQVAEQNGCKAIGIELNFEYCELILRRIKQSSLLG